MEMELDLTVIIESHYSLPCIASTSGVSFPADWLHRMQEGMTMTNKEKQMRFGMERPRLSSNIFLATGYGMLLIHY
jgi:hypothetical protein